MEGWPTLYTRGPRILCLTGLKLDFPMSAAIISGVTELITVDDVSQTHACTREGLGMCTNCNYQFSVYGGECRRVAKRLFSRCTKIHSTIAARTRVVPRFNDKLCSQAKRSRCVSGNSVRLYTQVSARTRDTPTGGGVRGSTVNPARRFHLITRP